MNEKPSLIHTIQKGRKRKEPSSEGIDNDLRNNLLLYTDNLLGRVRMDANLGQMVLELLSESAREELALRFAVDVESQNPEILDQLMLWVREPAKLRGAFDEALEKPGCPIRRAKMDQLLIDAFEESFEGTFLRNAYAAKLEQLSKIFGLSESEADSSAFCTAPSGTVRSVHSFLRTA